MKLYHGTNSHNTNDVIDNPKASKAINGVGFYVTLDVDTAGMYGKDVICWEINTVTANMIKSPIKLIDQRFTEDMQMFEECLKGGREIALTQQEADLVATLCEDAYLVTGE